MSDDAVDKTREEEFYTTLLVIWLLVLLNLLIFGQSIRFEFVTYDDSMYVTENETVLRGLSAEGVRYAFTSGDAGAWHPITWLSHMADVSMFGARPWGHHLTNIIIHLLNGIALYFCMFKLTGSAWRAGIVALVFAIHPQRAESVAWIADRKDLLCGFFFFLMVLSYVRYRRGGGFVAYGLTLALFACALMSKASAMTFPFVLLLLDLWPLGREGEERFKYWRARVLEKAPLVLLAVGAGGLTYFLQQELGAVASVEEISLRTRIANGFLAYYRYVIDFVWPLRLSILHPITPSTHSVALLAAYGLGIVAACVAPLFFWRRHGYVLVGVWWYVGMLAPVAGFIHFGNQSYSDRFTYLPVIGLVMAIVFSIPEAAVRHPKARWAFGAVCVLLMIGLSGVAVMQTHTWRNSDALFDRALKIEPNSYGARTNVGLRLMREGKLEEAREHLMVAATLLPDSPGTLLNLGELFKYEGNLPAAEEVLRAAVAMDPEYIDAWLNLATILAYQEKYEESRSAFETLLSMEPGHHHARTNLAGVLVGMKAYDEAEKHLRILEEAGPLDEVNLNNLGLVYAARGDLESAMRYFNGALAINPNYQPAIANIARYSADADLDGAIDDR